MDIVKKVRNWFNRNKSPLFMVAKKEHVRVSDGDHVDVKLICPGCRTYFADATAVLGSNMTSDHIRARAPYDKVLRVKEGEPLVCPSCGYGFTDWALQASVLAALNQNELERKSYRRPANDPLAESDRPPVDRESEIATFDCPPPEEGPSE